MFILANNETNKIYNDGYVSHSNLKEQYKIDKFKARILTKYSKKLGIPESKLEFYWVTEETDPNSPCQRIMNGESFDLVWTNDKITEIDFTPEDTKGYLKFETDKAAIVGDGNDTAEISLTVYEANKVIINEITATKLVPIKTPLGVIKAEMSVIYGVGTLQFKKINDLPLGSYSFPATGKYLWGFRIWEYVHVDVYLQM